MEWKGVHFTSTFQPFFKTTFSACASRGSAVYRIFKNRYKLLDQCQALAFLMERRSAIYMYTTSTKNLKTARVKVTKTSLSAFSDAR